jgi:hypothetical protein
VRSGLELLLLATKTAGVWERGDLVRDEAVSARPRVWLGSREAEEGLSIWCDAFPAAGRACRSGKDAATADTARVSTTLERGTHSRPRRPAHDTALQRAARKFRTRTPPWGAFHGGSHGRDDTDMTQQRTALTHAASLEWRIVWGSRRRLRAVRSGSGSRWRRERERCRSWIVVVIVEIPRTPASFLDASAHWWLDLR